jgi:hypothetical protein
MRKKGPGLDWAEAGGRNMKKKIVVTRQDLKIIFNFKASFLLFFY